MLSFYLARFLGLPESYWAAINAIIVMYSDVSRTVRASAYRLLGTAIGVSIGGAFAALFGQHIWAFGVAVTITMLICALLGTCRSLSAGRRGCRNRDVGQPRGKALDRRASPFSRSLFRNRGCSGDLGPDLAVTKSRPQIAGSS